MRVKKQSNLQRNRKVQKLVSNLRRNESYNSSEKSKNKRRMKLVRSQEEFRKTEKFKDVQTKRRLRLDDNYCESERLKNAEAKKDLRSDETYRVAERKRNVKAMKDLRSDEAYRVAERKKNVEAMKGLRSDEAYRVAERKKDVEAKKDLRSDETYRVAERKKDVEAKKDLRSDETYRVAERKRNVKAMKDLRSDEAYRVAERKKNVEAMKGLRSDEAYRVAERKKNVEAMKGLRSDEAYRVAERKKNVEAKKHLRSDEAYRVAERKRNIQAMNSFRSEDAYSIAEREKNAEAKKLRRAEDVYVDSERMRNREYMKNRRQGSYAESEKVKNRDAKEERRTVHLFRARENYYNLLRATNSKGNKGKLQFIRDRCSMPDKICCCCEGLFFNHSVVKFDNEKFNEKYCEEFITQIFNYNSMYICVTCSRQASVGNIPKMATSNGLNFVDIPECLRKLTVLEERMVAPYINFMQLRPLKTYALNPQIGMKGSVVNIPIDIDDMVRVLPRAFDNLATVQIKLKRHLMHKSDYLFETVRPASVYDALEHLVKTPLYLAHNITIDRSYFQQYANHDSKTEVDFIVDDNDKEDNEVSTQLSSSEFINNSSLKTADFDEDNNENSCDDVDEEVMLIDRNKEIVDNVQVIAPGQGKLPVPWHAVNDIDELCFPKIYCGHKFNTPAKFTYADRVKFEIRHRDRRACVPSRLLFMTKKKLEMSCLASINMCLRKTKRTTGMKAKHALDKKYLDNLMKFDEGYKVLKQIRSSPSYWETRKKELMATVRQLGKPTFFLTISAGETKWPELLKTLSTLQGSSISLQESDALSDYQKTYLIKNDPVTCARYFSYKMSKLMSLIKDGSIFGKYNVTDSYERVEFQQRGSPHEHVFLWLKDTPVYDASNVHSIETCVEFIDKFITCEYKDDDPYVRLQIHRHSHTCYKGKRNKNKCRFNFPVPAMPRTMILEPLAEEEMFDLHKERLSAVRKQMIHYSKNSEDVPFEEMLILLNLTENDYISALRSSLKRPQVFLRRRSSEVNVNGYNKDILHLFESNMDLQYVLEEYGIASYIIKYISKVDSGLSKILRDATSDANKGNKSIKEKFRSIANVFLNSNLMSAQEAAYHVLSMPLSKCSRKTMYINTSPREERARMLKTNAQLRCLSEDSTEIYMEDLFDKFSARPETLEHICLAQFASEYTAIKREAHFDEDNNCDLEESKEYRRKRKSSVIRYRRYKLEQDRVNYFREQVLLFLPWRNELQEVENVNCEEMYNNFLESIEENRKLFAVIGDDVLDQALENAQHDFTDIEEEEAQEFLNEKNLPEQNIDIMHQGGQEIAVNKNENRYSCPKRISQQDICSLISRLNEEQKDIVFHILNAFKLRKIPFYIFLSGSAGVGKSTVIRCVYQSITNYFDSQPGSTGDIIHVLLCAPSGKAAFIIEGVTLHTAFALPISQFGGQMPELSAEVASTLREKLLNVKLLIIDEISMVGSTLFNRVDSRLRQIMGVNKDFGGISVLVVGDLNQLPPVMDSPIYKMGKGNNFCELIELNPLWEVFGYFELKQIMRQKDEVEFIEALNALASGNMEEKHIELIKSRQVSASVVPKTAIRLYGENKSVDLYNDEKVKNHPGPEYVCPAKDVILGKVSETTKERALEGLRRKKLREVNGLPHRLHLKIGIKYMVTSNIDVEDGLVNGACGVLELISFENDQSEEPKILWFDFFTRNIGNKARLLHKRFLENNEISSNLVPIKKVCVPLNMSNKLQYQTLRTQFPIVPAEAITIHKSQGQTYEEVALDFNDIRRVTRPLLYVALSRVTSIRGLYIIGKFRVPKESKSEDSCLNELSKLKSTRNLYLSVREFKDVMGFKIAYQNVCSLVNKIEFIKNDRWYMKSDVLIFSETLTSENDELDLDGYKVIFRSDAHQGSRGLICFVKRNVDGLGDVVHHSIESNKDDHIELFTFTVHGITIISGYKSPRTAIHVFRATFENLINKVSCLKEIVVVGDLNINILNNSNTKLHSFFNKYKLQSVLPTETPTTEFNTQIDVIFATIPVYAGVYETYFSYHKPVFMIFNFTVSAVANMIDFSTTPVLSPTNVKRLEALPEMNIVIKSSIIQKNDFNHECRLQLSNFILVTPPNESKISPLVDRDYGDILNPAGVLSDIHIDYFNKILAKLTPFSPQSPLLLQLPELIIPHTTNSPNIQILFDGTAVSAEDIGHWVCSYYDGDVVHIFDSMNHKELTLGENVYLEKLYGAKFGKQFHPVQQQTNHVDCGFFSIAFAVSICFGRRPCEETYDITLLRNHTAHLFRKHRLELFPKI